MALDDIGKALTGHRVLVVDDDKGMCDLLTRQLTKRGAVLTCARNFDQMRAAVDADGTYTDVLLDGVVGHLPTAAHYARVRCGESIRVVVITYREDAAREAGAAWLPKPFEIDELVAVLT